MRSLLAAVVLLAALPAVAGAGYLPGGAVPGACAGGGFGDLVGTLGIDVATAQDGPLRLYGLTGDDWLAGSDSAASCLFGGRGDDMLALGAGGGVALGEIGADLLVGSELADGLSGGDGPDVLEGRGGDDVLRGGRAVDALSGGPGNDLLDSADGRPELVDCGPGSDTAIADALDVVISCERGQQAGKRLRLKRLVRQRGRRRTIFRMRFVVPVAGGPASYRVLVGGTCDDSLREVAALPGPRTSVRAGQVRRIRLRPPAGGWCRGPYGGTIVRMPPCPPGRACHVARPPEPIALLAFRVR